MTEHLRPCPWCGALPKLDNDGDQEWVQCLACGGSGPLRPIDGGCNEAWNLFALGPALDVVIEALEGCDQFGQAYRDGVREAGERYGGLRGDDFSFAVFMCASMALIRALRDATSPTDTPSGSGAQSGTGEAERGS